MTEEQPGRYRIHADPTPELTAALATWLARCGASMTELRTGRSLEEAYLDIVRAEEDPTDGTAGGTADGTAGGTARRPRRGRR